ncbi:MAG: hypothetical protein AB1567_13400 [bacterium]
MQLDNLEYTSARDAVSLLYLWQTRVKAVASYRTPKRKTAMKKLVLGLIIILICNHLAFGEIEFPSAKIEDEEDIWELYIEGEISYNDYQTLSYLYRHPLDLNEAKLSQIQELPNISFDLAQRIYSNRPFKTLEAIIPIIGKDLFDQIKVFIQVKRLWKKDFNLWMTDTQDDNKKADIKTRLCIYTKGMELAGFGKRDEDGFKLKKRYLMLENHQALKKVVIGNYQVRLGEGVVFNTAHRNNYRGVVLDDGERKSDNQDGILVETSFDKLNYTFFYSWVDLDKFPNSVLSKFDGKEKLWGGNFTLAKLDTHIGATAYVSNFTSKDGDSKKVEIWGVDFLKRFKDAEVAWEIAKSKNQGNGLFIRGYKKLSNFKYWLSLRRYEQDFINPHSMVKIGDEKGGCAKIEYVSNGLKLKAFGDYYKHFSTLITNEKYWTSIEYKLTPKVEITSKIEYEDKDVNRGGDENEIYYLKLDTKPHFKLDINSAYKYINKDEEISDYAYTKVIYHFKPMIIFTVRFKYGPDGDRQAYGQIKIKMNKKELITKYTHTHGNSHPHELYLRMKVKW